MGFFDEYKEEGGLDYVGKDEKSVLITNGTPLEVQRIFHSEAGQFGPKYTMIVLLNGDERAISFGAGKVESRDRMLDAMSEYLDTEEEVEKPVVKLVRVKQSVLIRNAADES